MRTIFETNQKLSDKELKTLLKYFPEGICAFDLEMTGLSSTLDKIIEIAGIKVDKNGKVQHYHSLVNPLIPIPEETIKYHQLTNDKLRDQPTLKKPLREFLDFFENKPLLAHNAIYDVGFLIKGMHEFNFSAGLSDIYDSCRFARSLYKKKKQSPENYKLSTLAKYYGVNFEHHQALQDAYTALKVFIGGLLDFEQEENKSLKDMAFLFKLNSFQRPEAYLLPTKLKDLKNLIKTRDIIYIKYRGGNSKGQYRPIRALNLMSLPQGLILYAECLQTNLNKYFHVKKIQSLKLEMPKE